MRNLFIFLIFCPFLLFSVSACPFCREKILRKQYVFETEKTVILYCLTPATYGNLLVIPKRHVERFENLTKEEILDIHQVISKAASVFFNECAISDYVIIQKNGVQAGQTVAHTHFHVIPTNEHASKMILHAFRYREKLTDEEMKQLSTTFQTFFKRNIK